MARTLRVEVLPTGAWAGGTGEQRAAVLWAADAEVRHYQGLVVRIVLSFPDPGAWRLRVTGAAPDRDGGGDRIEVHAATENKFRPNGSADELRAELSWMLVLMLRDIASHEVDEGFCLRGVRVRDPHG